MRHILAGLVLATLISCVFADEAQLPDFRETPKLYTYSHQIGGISSAVPDAPITAQVLDQLLLGDRTEESLKFHLYTVGTNYHICSLAGSARSISALKYEYREQNCLLSIELDGDNVRIEDVEGHCSEFGVGHCGSRTSIGPIMLTPTPIEQSEIWKFKR